jgi:hypothetical protein
VGEQKLEKNRLYAVSNVPHKVLNEAEFPSSTWQIVGACIFCMDSEDSLYPYHRSMYYYYGCVVPRALGRNESDIQVQCFMDGIFTMVSAGIWLLPRFACCAYYANVYEPIDTVPFQNLQNGSPSDQERV